MKKWIIMAVILVLAVGGGIWYFMKDGSEPTIAKAMTTTVQKGDIQLSISGSGSVEAKNSEDLTSSANVEVDEVLVDKNEIVEEGDELITFTDGSDPITAPFDGTVTEVSVEAGDRVNMNDVVAHLTDYKKLQTVISVDELDVSNVKKGQTVELTASAFEDESFTGKVESVAKEGTYENGVSSFDVTIQIDKPGKLRVGMSLEASILTESVEDALYIPIEAVQTNGGQKYVNVLSTAATTKQVVKIGINNDKYIEIKSGLKEGQTITLPLTISSNNNSSGKGRQGFPGGGEMPSGMPSGGLSGGGIPSGNTGGIGGGN